jgi:hypothetical protein
VNLSTGNVVLDDSVLTTNLPTPTAFLRPHAMCGPAASSTATQFELNRMYLESDY